ncbi:hypothetical protein V8C40DRAFT_242468 [Trichoderma camerunense]
MAVPIPALMITLKTEAAVVFEYSCDLCGFSTNVKKKFGRHNATQAHRARETEQERPRPGSMPLAREDLSLSNVKSLDNIASFLAYFLVLCPFS